jgi:hypothetical protein
MTASSLEPPGLDAMLLEETIMGFVCVSDSVVVVWLSNGLCFTGSTKSTHVDKHSHAHGVNLCASHANPI